MDGHLHFSCSQFVWGRHIWHKASAGMDGALGIMARKEKCYSMATHSVNLGDIIIGANEAKIPF